MPLVLNNSASTKSSNNRVTPFNPSDDNPVDVQIASNPSITSLINPLPSHPNSSFPPLPSSPFQQEWLANLAYDQQSRAKMIQIMNNTVTPQSYSDDEERILKVGVNLLNLVTVMKNMATFKTRFSAIRSARFFSSSTNGDVVGLVIADIRATPEEIISYAYDFKSKVFEAYRRDDSGVVDSSDCRIVEVLNSHSQIVYTVRHSGYSLSFSSRSFLLSLIWKRLDEKTIILAATSVEEHPDIFEPLESNIIRGHVTRIFKCTKIDDSTSRLEFAFNFNLNGYIPGAFTRQIAPRINIDIVVDILAYFQHLRPSDKSDGVDGVTMAEIMLHEVSIAMKESSWKDRWMRRSEIKIKAVNRFVDKNEALMSCEKCYSWTRELIAGLLSNKIADNLSSSSTLNAVDADEARRIGAGFSKCLKGNKSSEAGVAVWFGLNPSMRELCIEFPFFSEMLVVLGRRKLKEAPWGLIWRVGLGAFLSTLDMFTDIYTINKFYEQEKYGYAQASLVMIGACLGFTLILIFINCRKRGVKVILYESMIVLTCMKPAVDAYRVTSGTEMHEVGLFDPFYEMMASKQVEMFFEAIPACILQLYAYFSSSRPSLQPLISIAVSILSIAYSTSMLCYDLDMSPTRRAMNPSFYGYVPESVNAQFIVFSAMFLASFFQIILQVLGIVFLATINGLYVVIYLSADVGLYFLYKAICHDLRYFLNSKGVLSWIITFLVRLINKINTDFTMSIHFRHVYDLGGLYWSLNLVLHQTAAFVLAFFYLSSSDDILPNKLDEKTVWGVLIGSEISFLLCCAVFLMNMNSKYIRTFFTTATAKATAVALFRSCTADALRIDIFDHHPSYYADIRVELKEWVAENWSRWNDEKEEWFTSKVISNIPNDFIPIKALEYLEKNGRRKSTYVEMLLGGGQSTEAKVV